MTLQLYSYQKEAYKKFYKNNCRFYFAFDTGMGKTLTALNIAKDFDNVLIICPASVQVVWKNEMSKFGLFPKNHYEIVSYDLFRNKVSEILKTKWNLVIFDEAHRLKNVSAKITRVCMKVFPRFFKIMLSATPFEKFSDFYSQLKILSYKHQFHNMSFKTYKQKFFLLDYWEKIVDFRSERTKEQFYEQFVKPFVWFLKRDEVMELPSLIENNLNLDGEKDYYEILDVPSFTDNVLAYFITSYHQNSLLKSKIDFVIEFLKDNPRTVVFSQFQKPLFFIKNQLKDVYLITGSDKKDLSSVLTEGGKPLLATYSLKEGVDLSHYQNVIFLSLPLAYRDYYQSISRVHRVGQRGSVLVINLLAEELDRYVLSLLKRKKNVLEELRQKSLEQVQREVKELCFNTEQLQGVREASHDGQEVFFGNFRSFEVKRR